MAVVRFSEEFKDSIIGKAKGVFEQRIESQRKAVPQVGEAVLNLVYAPLMPLIGQMPSNFFIWRSDMELSRIGNTRYNLRFKLSQNYAHPHGTVDTALGKISGNYSIEIQTYDDPVFAPYKQQLDEYSTNLDTLIAQRDEFVDGVKKVINAHSTLAPALKAWPPLWELVAEEYRDRHRKVVERTKEAAPTIDVDLTKLTSTVAVAKILK